jgi:hypothetical protein
VVIFKKYTHFRALRIGAKTICTSPALSPAAHRV